MKTLGASFLAAAFMLFSIQSNGFATQRRLIIADEATFYSYVAQLSEHPGSPVGPKPKVKICHKGHTITVSLPAVPAHLAHGDSIGSCPSQGNLVQHGNGWPFNLWTNPTNK